MNTKTLPPPHPASTMPMQGSNPKLYRFVWVITKDNPYVRLSYFTDEGFAKVDSLGGLGTRLEYYTDVKQWRYVSLPDRRKFNNV